MRSISDSVSCVLKLKIIDTTFRIAITDMCFVSEFTCWIHRFRLMSSLDIIRISNSKNTTSSISLDSIFFVFRFTASIKEESVRLSRRWNSEFDVFWHQMWVVYKCKINKVQLINQSDSSSDCFTWITHWKEKVLQEKLVSILHRDLNLNLFSNLITLKFSDIMKELWLITVNVKNLKIESDLTLTEQQILMTVLFNREKALSWHFSHIERLQSEVVSLQWIRTVLHKI